MVQSLRGHGWEMFGSWCCKVMPMLLSQLSSIKWLFLIYSHTTSHSATSTRCLKKTRRLISDCNLHKPEPIFKIPSFARCRSKQSVGLFHIVSSTKFEHSNLQRDVISVWNETIICTHYTVYMQCKWLWLAVDYHGLANDTECCCICLLCC